MERARTEPLVVVVLVVAVVAGGFLLLSSHHPATQSNQCAPGETSLVTLLGTLTVPSGASAGNLTLTLENSTCSSITGVAVTAVQPAIPGVVNATFVEYFGTKVSLSNPLPVGQSAAGRLHVSGVAADQKYRLTVRVNLSSGAAAQTLTVIVQSRT